jgi:hypothetical protein
MSKEKKRRSLTTVGNACPKAHGLMEARVLDSYFFYFFLKGYSSLKKKIELPPVFCFCKENNELQVTQTRD